MLSLTSCTSKVSASAFVVASLIGLASCGSGDGLPVTNLLLSEVDGAGVQSGSQQLAFNDGLVTDGTVASHTADCENKLPCVWLSPDAGLILTVESVDTVSPSDNLLLRFSLQSINDTSIKWLPSAVLVDASARQYTLASTEIGDDSDLADTLEIFAGTRLGVRQSFRESPSHSTRSIARYAISFIEAGQRHAATFINLPIDGDNGEEIDCNSALPCYWTSPNEEYRVSLVLAENPLVHGRLTVHYQIEAFEDVSLIIGTDSIAIDNRGVPFTPKIHTVGTLSAYLEFEVPLFADSVTTGELSFFRTTGNTATELKKFNLDVTQDNAVVVGLPSFKNVPLD